MDDLIPIDSWCVTPLLALTPEGVDRLVRLSFREQDTDRVFEFVLACSTATEVAMDIREVVRQDPDAVQGQQ
jgi:hypothetical protein